MIDRNNVMYHNLLQADIRDIATSGAAWRSEPARWNEFVKFHRLPNEEIFVDGALYLRRHFIEPRDITPEAKKGARILLHEFFTGDDDKRPHNHPWEKAESAILTGGYDELRVLGFTQKECITTVKQYTAGDSHTLTGMDFHRILTVQPQTFTLFRHGPRIKNWGFLEVDESSVYTDRVNFRVENYVNGVSRHSAIIRLQE